MCCTNSICCVYLSAMTHAVNPSLLKLFALSPLEIKDEFDEVSLCCKFNQR